MTDRELLEYAAKAAGLRINFHPTASYQWNPLERGDDALRLAVTLQMEIAVFDNECHTRCIERGQREWIEEQGAPYAATRRAIVRAAAAIGKEMP